MNKSVEERRVNVLVVESDKTMLQSTADTLNILWSWGRLGNDLNIWRAERSRLALRYLCGRRSEDLPQLILSSIRMPGMDGWGWTLLRALKHNEQLRCIPVILMAAQLTDGGRVQADYAGAAGYIKKPIVLQELHTAFVASGTFPKLV
jgi:CheY-like chemotaxis protein